MAEVHGKCLEPIKAGVRWVVQEVAGEGYHLFRMKTVTMRVGETLSEERQCLGACFITLKLQWGSKERARPVDESCVGRDERTSQSDESVCMSERLDEYLKGDSHVASGLLFDMKLPELVGARRGVDNCPG